MQALRVATRFGKLVRLHANTRPVFVKNRIQWCVVVTKVLHDIVGTTVRP